MSKEDVFAFVVVLRKDDSEKARFPIVKNTKTVLIGRLVCL